MNLTLVKMGLKRPLPIEVTAVTRPFWEGLAREQFMVPACGACGRLSFPPRALCPGCHGAEFDWRPLSGRGVLYSATKVQNSPAIYGILSPFTVAVVDLQEGLRVVTRLLPVGRFPELDSPVELVITDHPDGRLYAARLL